MNMTTTSAGTNLIEATHIILAGKQIFYFATGIVIHAKKLCSRVFAPVRASNADEHELTPISTYKCADPVRGTKEEAQAVETQAIGRAYRQGQKRQVVVARFITRKSIEYQTYSEHFIPQVHNIIAS